MNVSPYISEASRRASMIGTLPPMAVPLPSISEKTEIATFYDRTLPRTQREAGLENLAWEDRAPPLRSWTKDIAAAIGWAISIAFLAWFVVPLLVEILK